MSIDVTKEMNEAFTYVQPEEGCFTWELSDDGIAITGYDGPYDAIVIPDVLEGQTVIEIRNGIATDAALKAVILPDTVKTIGEDAFNSCTTLQEVRMGEHTEIIGDGAFIGCRDLRSVVLDDALRRIGAMAFAGCDSLTQIELPSHLEILDKGAFYASGLASVDIPGSVMTIGLEGFASCKALRQVTIEEGTVCIEANAFADCASLETVHLPASLEDIGLGAFSRDEIYASDSDILPAILEVAGITIYAPAGSQAELFAEDNGIAFQATT